MLQQIKDTFDRAVAASTKILVEDGDQSAHAERLAAVEAIVFGDGLDLGQVARAPRHGNPEWKAKPLPPRDTVSSSTLAFLKRQKLA